MPEQDQGWSRLARRCCLLVAVVTCWQVRDIAEFDFVEFDDGINIVFNMYLGPWSRDTVVWAFSDLEYMRRYVPVGWMGFSLVYGFSGLSPSGYHMAGAAAQVASAMLVFAIALTVLRRFAASAEDRWRIGCATLAALGWSLHPMRAEAVGWASGLFYSLSAVGALLSVLAYLRAWSPGARRGRWVALAGALHLGAMLAYPMSVGVFGVFVLLDLAFWRSPCENHAGAEPGRLSKPSCDESLTRSAASVRRLVYEKVALAVPVAVVAGLTVLASHHAPAFWLRPPSWAEFGGWDRLQQAAAAWVYFLGKPWWPVGLTPVPTWLVDAGAVRFQAVASFVAVAAVSLGLIAGWRRWRGVALLWFAHACLLAPMLGLTERPYFPSDRYHHLAGVVLVVAVALGLVRVRGAWRVACGVGGAVVIVTLAILQRQQLRIWTNTDTLMGRIVQRAENAAVRQDYQERWIRFHANRGNLARAAAVASELGLDLNRLLDPAPGGVPPTAALHLKLALAFVRARRTIEAHEHFETVLKLVPDWGEAAYNLGLLHASEGAALAALGQYTRAVAPGRGTPVALAARLRLLTLIADAFFATRRPGLAVRTVDLALAEAGAAGAAPELLAQLRAQQARYGAP